MSTHRSLAMPFKNAIACPRSARRSAPRTDPNESRACCNPVREMVEQVGHRVVRTMRGDEVVAQKRSPPIALAAGDQDGLAPFVAEPIERSLDCQIGAPLSLRARGSASTSAHHSSPVGSCGCAHDRRSTASRACTIATTRFAMSGRAESSKTKFGEVAVICPFTAGVSITKGY